MDVTGVFMSVDLSDLPVTVHSEGIEDPAADPLCLEHVAFPSVVKKESENETEVFVKNEPSDEDTWSYAIYENDLRDNGVPERDNVADISSRIPAVLGTSDKEAASTEKDIHLAIAESKVEALKNIPCPENHSSFSRDSLLKKRSTGNNGHWTETETEDNINPGRENHDRECNVSLGEFAVSRTGDKNPGSTCNNTLYHNTQQASADSNVPGDKAGFSQSNITARNSQFAQNCFSLSRNKLLQICRAENDVHHADIRTNNNDILVQKAKKKPVVLLTRNKVAERLVDELTNRTSGSDSRDRGTQIVAPSNSGKTTAQNISLIMSASDNFDTNKIPRVRLRKMNVTGKWKNAAVPDEAFDIENVIGAEETLLLMRRAGIMEDVELQHFLQMEEKRNRERPNTKGIGLTLNDRTLEVTSKRSYVEDEVMRVAERDKLMDGNSDEMTATTATSHSLNHKESTSCDLRQQRKCLDCQATFESESSWRGHRPRCPVRRRAKGSGMSSHTLSVHIKNIHKSSQVIPTQLKDCIESSPAKIRYSEKALESSRLKLAWTKVKNGFQLSRTKTSNVRNDIGSSHTKSAGVKSDFKALKYACKMCGKILSCQSILRKHTERNHEKISFWCHICGKGFPISLRLKTHLRIHTGIQPYQCDVCDKSYTTIYAVKLHKRKTGHKCAENYVNVDKIVNNQSCIEAGTVQCNICEKSFLKSDKLKTHYAIHTKPPHEFDIFDNITGQTTKLSNILQNKDKELPPVQSGKTLTSHSNSLNEVEETFSCQICDKMFSTDRYLKEHSNYHKGESRFRCDECQMAYRTADGLRNHHNSAHKNISFKCHHCNESFSTLFFLSKHKCLQSATADPSIQRDLVNSTHNSGNVHEVVHDRQPSLNPVVAADISVHNLKRKQCAICGKVMSSVYDLKTHMFGHLDEKSYQCQECGEKFVCFYHCKEHQHSHSKVMTFKCDICDNMYSADEELKSHKMLHRKEQQTFKCDICDRMFNVTEELKFHKNLHRKEHQFTHDLCVRVFASQKFLDNVEGSDRNYGKKVFSCNVCNQQFTSTDAWKAHSLIHIRNFFDTLPTNIFPLKKEALYSCSLCATVLTSKSGYQRHMDKHTQSYRYKCKVCAKGFFSNSRLEDHMYLHTNERPYKCKLCHLTYASRETLRRHACIYNKGNKFASKSNVGKNNYKCDMCSSAFRTQLLLSRHKHIFHFRKISHQCSICSKSFPTKSLLYVHCKEHERQHFCPQCDKSFQSLATLKNHLLTHTAKLSSFDCNTCFMTFPTALSLKRHTCTHTVVEPLQSGVSKAGTAVSDLNIRKNVTTALKRYKCIQCKKTFVHYSSLSRHKLTHIGEKPFTCKLCSATFQEQYKLKLHMRTHEADVHEFLPQSYTC